VRLGVLNLLVFILLADIFYIEPFRLGVTYVTAPAPAAAGLPPHLRIVHLTDIHVERITKRERRMVELVNSLDPDLILMTGDYPNLSKVYDPVTQQEIHELLSQLHARYGIYAVTGTVDRPESTAAIFAGLPVTLLDNEVVRIPVGGGQVYIAGIGDQHLHLAQEQLAGLTGQLPPADAYTILLYHTPDLIEQAAALNFDLYLAGHTHGGQVRLPFYGAIFTATAHGKMYEAGKYELEPTTLYVSRGLGMEGFWWTPRIRFLCRPEVVDLDLWGLK
jgi:hypothetical protein